jgi:hypothetical protein
MTDPQREPAPAADLRELDLPPAPGGHPAIETEPPEVLDDPSFVAAVTGVDHVDIDPDELIPLGADRFGDDTPKEV